ncbi:hypothetical protein P3T76_000695 [Phytophthora citrophthora]|uniref:Uncharacterized protein n=1 Tax=Phytophthora citrophthora TaxID=4793 RepID=A0AAD9H1N4_9STRA|nr:hypothetical protein P3T76_000695 [Phytophthora citrophthora]
MVGLTAKQLAQETLCAGDTIDYYRVGFVIENQWLRTSKVLTVDASNSRSPIKLVSGDPSDPSMWIKRKMDARGVLITTAKWRTLKTFTMVDGNIEEPTDAQVLCRNLASIVEDVLATHSGGLASTSADTYPDDASLGENHLTLLAQKKVSSETLPLPLCRDLSDGDVVAMRTARLEYNQSNPEIVNISGGKECGLNTDNTAQTELTSGKARMIHRGMSFSTATNAIRAVKDFALANGKSMIVVRRSGMDRQLKCTSSKCTSTVPIYRRRKSDRTYGHWCTSRVSEEYINCTSMPKPTTRQIAENPTFRSAVNAAPNSKASSLVALLRECDGISLQAQMRSVYRARDLVNETEASSLHDSYQLIESYLSKQMQIQPA